MLTTETIQRIVTPVLRGYPDVYAAFLFGSHAAGTPGGSSDVDIALVGPRDGLGEQKLDILADLVRAGLDNVDLVLLDGADPALRFEAVRPNCLVYATPDFDRGSYYSLALREYFDFEPYLQVQREALQRRLRGGPA